jgi:hypothetical protein
MGYKTQNEDKENKQLQHRKHEQHEPTTEDEPRCSWSLFIITHHVTHIIYSWFISVFHNQIRTYAQQHSLSYDQAMVSLLHFVSQLYVCFDFSLQFVFVVNACVLPDQYIAVTNIQS